MKELSDGRKIFYGPDSLGLFKLSIFLFGAVFFVLFFFNQDSFDVALLFAGMFFLIWIWRLAPGGKKNPRIIIGPQGVDMPSLGAFKWDEIDYISKIYIKYRRRSENWAELVISAGARERGGSAYLLFHISNPERYKFDFLDPIAMKEQFKLYISDIEKNERKLMEEELQKYKTLAVERSVRYIENRNDDFM